MAFIRTRPFANYPGVAIIGYSLTNEIQISVSIIKHCMKVQEMFSLVPWRKISGTTLHCRSMQCK